MKMAMQAPDDNERPSVLYELLSSSGLHQTMKAQILVYQSPHHPLWSGKLQNEWLLFYKLFFAAVVALRAISGGSGKANAVVSHLSGG
jgi:hypothetical protein